MFENERALYALNLDYIRLLTDDLDDARLAVQPVLGMNHAAWILGHLAIVTDMGRTMFGRPLACPEAWRQAYGPGTTPKGERLNDPKKSELLNALIRGHEEVSQLAAGASPEAMAQPHSLDNPFLKRCVPTVGGLLAHLMTTHEATHIGQLSAWRRACGLPAVTLA